MATRVTRNDTYQVWYDTKWINIYSKQLLIIVPQNIAHIGEGELQVSVASGSSGCVCDFGMPRLCLWLRCSVCVCDFGRLSCVCDFGAQAVSVTSEGSAVSVASVLRLCLLLGAQAISRELSWWESPEAKDPTLFIARWRWFWQFDILCIRFCTSFNNVTIYHSNKLLIISGVVVTVLFYPY